MSDMPLHLQFTNMAKSHAYKAMVKKIEENIADESAKFFKMAKSDESEEQRVKVKHYQDFLDELKILVINSQNEPNKNQKKRIEEKDENIS